MSKGEGHCSKMELNQNELPELNTEIQSESQHKGKRKRGRKRRHSETMLMEEPSTDYNEKAVRILDNIVVPGAILRTMARGQSFNHPSKFKIIQNSTKDEQLQLAIINEDLKATKKYLKENESIIITSADKGNVAIIHKRSTFISYRTEHMNTNLSNITYTILADTDRKRIKEQIEKRFSDLVKEIGSDIGLTNATTDEILEQFGCPLSVQDKVFVPGRLFGKLKVHKEIISYRPIVDISVRLGRPLEEHMQRMLSVILNRNTEYSIKNTLEFISKLKKKYSNQLILPRGHVMMKIDFENMFTNVPTKKALEIIKRLWNEYVAEQPAEEEIRLSGETVRKVIEFFIKESCGFFTCDNVLYKQEKGLVMGASLSAAIATILIIDTILKVKPFLQEKTFIAVYDNHSRSN